MFLKCSKLLITLLMVFFIVSLMPVTMLAFGLDSSSGGNEYLMLGLSALTGGGVFGVLQRIFGSALSKQLAQLINDSDINNEEFKILAERQGLNLAAKYLRYALDGFDPGTRRWITKGLHLIRRLLEKI